MMFLAEFVAKIPLFVYNGVSIWQNFELLLSWDCIFMPVLLLLSNYVLYVL